LDNGRRLPRRDNDGVFEDGKKFMIGNERRGHFKSFKGKYNENARKEMHHILVRKGVKRVLHKLSPMTCQGINYTGV